MHPQLAHLLLADHPGGDVLAVGVRQLTRLRGEVACVTDIRRHVAEIFCRFDAAGDRQTVLNGTFAAGQLPTSRHVEDHFTQRTTRLGFVGFQLIEAVEGLFCRLDRLAHFPVGITPLNVQFGQEADRLHRASIIQRIYRFLNNLLVLALVQLTLFAAANQ